MSSSEVAVAGLKQALGQLIPALLDSLSTLRQQNPTQLLLEPTLVLDTLDPLTSQGDLQAAFAVRPSSSDSKEDSAIRIRNLCLEVSNNELRRFVFESSPTTASSISEEEELPVSTLKSIFDRLDAVLALSARDLIDSSLPLSLIEELLEVHTIPTCSHLFSYTESRVKQLTVDLHPTKGKGLVLLRTCNELLRRLSKPSQEHTVFAGRILSLLAAVFPLGERSGVNLRGDFNTENKTSIEEVSPDSEKDNGALTDKENHESAEDKDSIFKVNDEFYELFWKVQRFFSNPPLLMGAAQEGSRPSTRSATPAVSAPGQEGENGHQDEDPAPDGAKGPMSEFRISTQKIINLFAAVTKREKELAGAAAAENGKNNGVTNGEKRNYSSTQDGVTGYFAGRHLGHTKESDGEGGHRQKRFKPDIQDGRRVDSVGDSAMEDGTLETESPNVSTAENTGHFFPKYLTGRKLFEYEIRDTSFRKHILVQYLVLFQYLLSFTPAAKEGWKDWKNKTLQALFTLEEADERWIRSTWREIQSLIRDIQPDGRLFLETVLEVLKRETNWIRWKMESCPSIEKPPLSPDQIEAFASARSLLLRKPHDFPHKLGTAALSELWLDGLAPPQPGSRKTEDEMGNEVIIQTDGLEELEFMPPIPSLEHYHKSIKREQMKFNMRKKQLGIDPEVPTAKLSREEQDKLDSDERAQTTIEAMQSLAWRALRVASRDNLHLFGKLDRPENIEALLKVMEEERNPKPKPKPKPKASTSEDGTKKEGEEKAGSATEKEKAEEEDKSAEGVKNEVDAEEKQETKEGTDGEAVTVVAAGETETTQDDKEPRETAAVPVAVPTVPASPQPEEPSTNDGGAEKKEELIDPTQAEVKPDDGQDVEMTDADAQS